MTTQLFWTGSRLASMSTVVTPGKQGTRYALRALAAFSGVFINGTGVGVGVGVVVGVGVAVGEGVTVGVRVGVGLGVAVDRQR